MTKPRVSIGLPVYNGGRYLRAAVDSLLSQTFGDFELIISDNASEDGTADIALGYAREDRRVQYCRSNVNRGASWNFNHVFHLAKGEYFRWAAHDDVCASSYLRECVDALDRRSDIVLSTTKACYLNQDGQTYPRPLCRPHPPRVDSPRPHERFHDLICFAGHGCLDVFGLIRSSVLARTPLIGPYVASDLVLVAELSLHGRFHEVPQCLFYNRDHPDRLTRAFPKAQSRGGWWVPGQTGRIIFPTWRLLPELVGAVRRSPLSSADRRRCLLQLLPWMWKKKKRLRQDLYRPLLNFTARRRQRLFGEAAISPPSEQSGS